VNLNRANAITIGRILLIPVFIAFALSKIPYGPWLAIAVFSVAAITDGLDGYYARSRNQVTTLGKLLDPLADKLLITAALVSLVDLNKLSAWIAVVIIGREFAVTTLRIVAVDQGVVIPASGLGKIKTIVQISCIIELLFPHEQLWGPLWYAPWVDGLTVALMVTVTLLSGAQYFLRARDRLSAPTTPPA